MIRWHLTAAALVLLLLTLGALFLRWQALSPPGGHADAADDLFDRFLIERPHTAVQAEPFEAVAVNDASPRLADYRGRYILLNFWATWCEPCKEEMPALEALYRDLRGQNLVVLAVSMQESPEKVAEFLQRSPFSFPVLADPEGRVSELYGVVSIPLTYLIRPDGLIEGRALGPRKWNDPALRAYFARAARGR
jgi:peroxiredoxin